MADIFELTTPISIPSSVPASIVDSWVNNMKNNAISKIKARFDAIAVDPISWGTNIAEGSSAAFIPFVATAFVSRKGQTKDQITNKQLQKLRESHTAALLAHDAVFANDALLFKAAIDLKKPNLESGILRTLASTGHRLSTRGKGTIHVNAWAGDQTVVRDLQGADILTGTISPATPFIPVGLRQQFKAGMMGLVTQAIVNVLEGVTVSGYNTRLDDLLTAFLDPLYVDPPTSFIHLEEIVGGIQLHSLAATA